MYPDAANVFTQLVARLAEAMHDQPQVASVMEVGRASIEALDREFGAGNDRSRSLVRLMGRLQGAEDARLRVETIYRIGELLAATANDIEQEHGGAVNSRGIEFLDSLPSSYPPDSTS